MLLFVVRPFVYPCSGDILWSFVLCVCIWWPKNSFLQINWKTYPEFHDKVLSDAGNSLELFSMIWCYALILFFLPPFLSWTTPNWPSVEESTWQGNSEQSEGVPDSERIMLMYLFVYNLCSFTTLNCFLNLTRRVHVDLLMRGESSQVHDRWYYRVYSIFTYDSWLGAIVSLNRVGLDCQVFTKM